MFGQGLPVERLRKYILDLKPEARAQLVAELERSLLRGDGAAGAELVLNELRRSQRDANRNVQDIGNSARLFFQPLEPFLVDDSPEHPHSGRVARQALDPIWQWICTAVMKTEAADYTEQVERALIANDANKAAELARIFQDRAAPRMREALDAIKNDDRAGRRLNLQIGPPRAIEDVRIISGGLIARDSITALGGQMPQHIKSLSGATLGSVKALLDSPIGRTAEMFPFALILVMNRLAARSEERRVGKECRL